MLLLFSLFHLICFLKTGCFFHVICFLRTGCFFHVICFIKTGCFKCCLFWLLSILCFVVNNDFRQKKYQVSDIQSYHPGGRDGMGLHWSFTIQSSSQMLLLFHVICFFKTGCFRCFKFSCFFHVICSIKTGCFRCFVFGYFFMSYVSSKLVDSNVWCLVDSVVKQCHHF